MYKNDKKKSFKYSGKITLLNIITCFFENSLTVFFLLSSLYLFIFNIQNMYSCFFSLSLSCNVVSEIRQILILFHLTCPLYFLLFS